MSNRARLKAVSSTTRCLTDRDSDLTRKFTNVVRIKTSRSFDLIVIALWLVCNILYLGPLPICKG